MQFPANLSLARRQLLVDAAKMAHLSYSPAATVHQKWVSRNNPKALDNPFNVFKRVSQEPECVTYAPCDAQAYLIPYEPPIDTTADGSANIQAKPLLVMAARGTCSLVDWMSDCEVAQTRFLDVHGRRHYNARVHDGFNSQMLGLASLMNARVLEHLQAGNHLLCTGHSLGGAASCIAAAYYGSTFSRQVWHVSFGAPRAGNHEFAQMYNQSIFYKYRVKNCADPVPLSISPIEYEHGGCEIHVGPPDVCPDIPVLLNVGDHDISKYVCNLADPDHATASKSSTTRQWLSWQAAKMAHNSPAVTSLK